MNAENKYKWSSCVSITELNERCLSLRYAAILGIWNLAFIAIMSLGGPESTLAVICLSLLFWILYWPLCKLNNVGYYGRSVSLMVDNMGFLHARWGLCARRWSANQWYYRSRMSKRELVIKWPWCLFTLYSIFPEPHGEEQNKEAQQAAPSNR